MELGVRNKEIINKLKENGVTYNVYDRKRISSAMEIRSHSFVIHQSEWLQLKRVLFKELTY
jgi:uncharacterized circularly permuted ATP-grasp superfamily protein